MSIDVIESEPTFLPSKTGQGLGRRLGDAVSDRLVVLQKSVQVKREAAAQLRREALGSIIPGFVSTGEALTAMENTKAFIDSLDEQIGNSFCARRIDSSLGFPIFADCKAEVRNFLVTWYTLEESFYTFYLDNRGFLSRFADTNSIFERARAFAQRANVLRTQAISLGANVQEPALRIDKSPNPLDDLFAWAKVLGIIAAVVVLAPPVINMVRRATAQPAMAGLEGTRKLLPKSYFDKRSFRWVKSGKAKVLIGCPKGKWQPRKKRCKVGTRAYEVVK